MYEDICVCVCVCVCIYIYVYIYIYIYTRHIFNRYIGSPSGKNYWKDCKPNLLQLSKLSLIFTIWATSSVQFGSVAQSCLTLCDPMDGSTPGLLITNSWSLLKLMSIKSVLPSNHLILCQPLLLLPSIFPSIMFFSSEWVLWIRWPKYWSFSFSISPTNEHPGLISFRMDWLDLLAVQGTLKSLLQHHSSKASIFRCSTFFTVQLSHPYMTTGKTIALTRQTFVGKVVSLLFNMLSRLVITFLQMEEEKV